MSRFAGLPDRLKATAPNDTPHQPTDEQDAGSVSATSDLKEPDMADKDLEAAVAAAKKEGHADGFKAANARISTVFASDEAKGREASAVKLLTKESMAGASAEDVVEILAEMPKADKAALSGDEAKKAAEDAGRQEMKDVLGTDKNSNVKPSGSDGGPDAAANVGKMWDSAMAKVYPNSQG